MRGLTWLFVATALTGCVPNPDPDQRAVSDGALTDEVMRQPMSADEVHSIHAPLGIPVGMPSSNDLIFRRSCTASTNDETKFADWVAYSVIPDFMTDLPDGSDPLRNYRTDPFLDDDETLEARPGMGDYENAYLERDYDRGHLVPLHSFRGSPDAEEINYLSVLAPQLARLNRGRWRSLENAVRNLAKSIGEVYVLAGPYYDPDEDPMPPLPEADESHVVPTGYWMIVYAVPAIVGSDMTELSQGVCLCRPTTPA